MSGDLAMSVKLLDHESVVPYLLQRNVISTTDGLVVEELSGGVSNVVLGVKNREADLVLKQALAELKVATKWVADQKRAIVEARAVQLFHSISPTNVPALLDYDPEKFTLVIERAPRTSRVWKTELLAGRINPAIGSSLGEILATWHRFGATSQDVAAQFAEDSLFDQLRIDPFYREISKKNPELSERLDSLIAELKDRKETIVHGDFSPKNFLVDQDRDVYILDFEVAHYGNPVFDQAFVLAHLLCKFFRTQVTAEQSGLRETAKRFLESYHVTMQRSLDASLPLHVAAIALARVEGKSRVDYLDEMAQEALKRTTKKALSSSLPIGPLALFNQDFS